MPYYFKMGIVAADRTDTAQNAISFKDALRAFRNWNSGSVPVRVSFRGKAAFAQAVKVSMNGLVATVDPRGIVTVSGEGREIKLDLNVCEFAITSDSVEQPGSGGPLTSDPALRLAFPNGAICVVFPCQQVSGASESTRTAGGSELLPDKLGSSPVTGDLISSPPADFPARELVRRTLCVDVHHGQANIVEIVDKGNAKTRIRRLKEQFLSRADRMRADRLKRQITYGENGGTYDVDGLYRPQTVPSLGKLMQLVEWLERQDGPVAWDRRRYPR